MNDEGRVRKYEFLFDDKEDKVRKEKE